MSQNDIEEPIKKAPTAVQEIVREVIRVEKENRHSERPRVKDEILSIIRKAVK